MQFRRWRRHTEWVGRVRDVQRSFVSICGPCETARVLYPPYAPKQRHLPGLSREAVGVSIPWVESVCRISEHLRPPLLECHGESSQPISSARCLAAGYHSCVYHFQKRQSIKTRDGMKVVKTRFYVHDVGFRYAVSPKNFARRLRYSHCTLIHSSVCFLVLLCRV